MKSMQNLSLVGYPVALNESPFSEWQKVQCEGRTSELETFIFVQVVARGPYYPISVLRIANASFLIFLQSLGVPFMSPSTADLSSHFTEVTLDSDFCLLPLSLICPSSHALPWSNLAASP